MSVQADPPLPLSTSSEVVTIAAPRMWSRPPGSPSNDGPAICKGAAIERLPELAICSRRVLPSSSLPPMWFAASDARGRSMLDRPEIAAKTFLNQGRVGNRYRPATIAVCYGGTAAGVGCRRGKPRARRGRLEAGSGCIRRRDGRPLAIVLTCVAGNASLRTVVRHVRPKPQIRFPLDSAATLIAAM